MVGKFPLNDRVVNLQILTNIMEKLETIEEIGYSVEGGEVFMDDRKDFAIFLIFRKNNKYKKKWNRRD